MRIREAWSRFSEKPQAVITLFLLAFLFLLGLLSGVLSNDRPLVLFQPGPDKQWFFPLLKNYPAAMFHWDESVLVDYLRFSEGENFKRSGGWALFPPVKFGPNRVSDHLAAAPPTAPDSEHWLGTDDRGRDVLSRLLYGIRNSFWFALVVAFGSSLLGAVIGSALGCAGGKVDLIGQRVMEFWAAIPAIYLALFISVCFRANLNLLICFWVCVGWPVSAQYVRGEVLSLKQREYFLASKLMGLSFFSMFRKHLVPALFPVLSFVFSYTFAWSLMILTSLDFLGMGLPAPSASLGELIRQGYENMRAWWLVVIPLGTLAAILFLSHVLVENLRRALDVRKTV